MSMIVARMQKMKAENLVGIGNHNQRKTKNHSNPDIDTSLSELNYDLVNRTDNYKNEIGSIYKSAKSFLKERTSDLKTFKSLFSELVNKVKEKSPKGEFERLERKEKSREKDRGMSL